MKNTLQVAFKRLFSKAEDAKKGCELHEVELSIKQNKGSDVLADFNTAKTKDNSYQAAKGGRKTAFANHKTATAEARTWIRHCREHLKKFLGTPPSDLWAEAGFSNQSLAIPATSEDLLPLLLSLNALIIAHPTYEADQVEITADAALAQHDALFAARAGVNACRTDRGTKRVQRNTAVKKLRTRLRGLVTELKQLMPGDDARWHAFGFNPPDAVGLPGVPQNLVITGGIAGHLSGTWDPAPLTDRYRLYRKIIGVDSDYVLVKTVTETEADLNTFTTGQVVKVRVSAVNDAGESLLSEPVEQVVP